MARVTKDHHLHMIKDGDLLNVSCATLIPQMKRSLFVISVTVNFKDVASHFAKIVDMYPDFNLVRETIRERIISVKLSLLPKMRDLKPYAQSTVSLKMI